MNPALQHSDRREPLADPIDPPVSVSHFVHVLRAYAPVIGVVLLSVAVGYAAIAIALYVLAPSQRTTMQAFRLEFRGANEGTLPNGIRFSATEIISTPILLKVFEANNLASFTNFTDFSRAIFILESNREYEKLVNEFQSRLSDARLTPMDRDRIQKEFEARRESINKSDYALCYAQTSRGKKLPESLVRKVLADTLTTWANFAINDQHALQYQVSVLSPQILDQREIGSGDVIASIAILRSKVYRVVENIYELSELPAAELVKTKDGMSLAEIRMRLEDIVRFRLEPLVGVARASGMVTNPGLTIHFLENQLAYDQRRLQAARAAVAATRDALSLYANEQPRGDNGSIDPPNTASSAGPDGETVMPQLSDTFLDRLVTLSKQATDSPFRQKVIEKYQTGVEAMIPLEQAVSYEQQVLDLMKSGAPSAAPRADGQTVRAEIDAATAEVRQLIGKVNEIYRLVSRNLNPTTQLISTLGPPMTRIERTRSLSRLGLYGLVLMLITLPLTVLGCLLHNRIREEEEAAVTPQARSEQSGHV